MTKQPRDSKGRFTKKESADDVMSKFVEMINNINGTLDNIQDVLDNGISDKINVDFMLDKFVMQYAKELKAYLKGSIRSVNDSKVIETPDIVVSNDVIYIAKKLNEYKKAGRVQPADFFAICDRMAISDEKRKQADKLCKQLAAGTQCIDKAVSKSKRDMSYKDMLDMLKLEMQELKNM